MVFHLVNSWVRSLMQTCPEQWSWDQLLSCLSTNNIAELETLKGDPGAGRRPPTIRCAALLNHTLPLARTCFFSRYRKIDNWVAQGYCF
jgi:hypothetical protein